LALIDKLLIEMPEGREEGRGGGREGGIESLSPVSELLWIADEGGKEGREGGRGGLAKRRKMGFEMSEIRVERETKGESMHGQSTLWYRGGAKETMRLEDTD